MRGVKHLFCDNSGTSNDEVPRQNFQVIGMDRVQVHPTAFVDPAEPAAATKFLAAEALRGRGALVVSV